ncbi:unnamed protein product [Notodromas monacha]|uniref:WD repeat domain phosphoinositide-interacting protein 4 n=1 Tax=Notodromas monacha TaxID=399045 RepID=A0A7R9BS04_9CRUS|nr:unnamed protein product [Notodromas monacha]CAG0919712.1 unnamed protein product [Notodromas monacha]
MAHRYRVDSGDVVHSLQFNQDQRAEKVGSIKACYLLHRTNLLALIGGGKRPKFAENSVVIFDDAQKECLHDFTFSSAVLAVCMQRDRFLVVLERQIHVFSFPRNPERIFSVETRANPRGVFAVSPSSISPAQILVYPCHKIGTVQAVNLSTAGGGVTSSPTSLHAHQSEIACLALNSDSTLLATASRQGTLIRVFDLSSKKKVIELRRGSDPARLYCINFSPNNDYLCCSADTGTVHIFALRKTSLNRRSALSKMGISLGNYVESQWALTTFTVPPECACLCAFVDTTNVAAVCLDGTFHRYAFNPDGGKCTRVAFDIFLDLFDEDEF